MSEIPNIINGVSIEFSPNVNNNVDKKIINALRSILSADIAPGHVLTKIYISSANDQHNLPSRHVQGEGKAIDNSRINGLKMSTHYEIEKSVKAIADALQEKFEQYPHKRENFGPFFKKKLGSEYPISGHKDHIHFSVN